MTSRTTDIIISVATSMTIRLTLSFFIRSPRMNAKYRIPPAIAATM